MNNTLDLVEKLEKALKGGAIAAGEIPVEDLKACVRLELETNHITYLQPQYESVLKAFDGLCSLVSEGESDTGKMELFFAGLKLSLHTISELALSLANREYWEKMHAGELPDDEIEEIIEYIDRRKQIRLLNYDFVDGYMARECDVFMDEECSMHYVLHKGKRMYFPARMGAESVKDYYNNIIAEQDLRSPHCYLKDGYNVEEGDVLVDVGGAEGYFTLDNIDKVERAYIFDADMEWITALIKTFEPFADKVEIIQGYVGNKDDGMDKITLDRVLSGKSVDYIKMDIEGYERGALEGAKGILDTSDRLSCAICAYHCEGDEAWIRAFFEKHGYETDCSGGYMCPDWCSDGLLKAQLRRGVVFARKKDCSKS